MPEKDYFLERKLKRVRNAAKDYGFATRTASLWTTVEELRESLTARRKQKWLALEKSVRDALKEDYSDCLVAELHRIRNKPIVQSAAFPAFVSSLCRVTSRIQKSKEK